MINWLIMAAGIVIVSYDPAMKLLAYVRGFKKTRFEQLQDAFARTVPAANSPTRLEAFNAAETLVAYYRSIGHNEAATSASEAAQKLFTEPPAK